MANTGSGTIFTSGVASGAAAAVSGSGKSVLIPVSGKQPFVLLFLPFLLYLPERVWCGPLGGYLHNIFGQG